MDFATARFGKLSVMSHDMLLFEQGMIGLRHCRRWVVLADLQNPDLGWLQSVDDPDVALAVVSPRRYVPDYQLRIDRQELQQLQLASMHDAQVVAILSLHSEGLAINLRAPLVINVEARRGRQVVSKDPLPTRMFLAAAPDLRLTA